MALDIAIVSASLSPAAGGIFESIRGLAAQLGERSAKVTVYGLQDYDYVPARWSHIQATVKAFPRRWPERFGRSPELMREMLAARHDIVHLHGLWMYPTLAVNAWRRRGSGATVVS